MIGGVVVEGVLGGVVGVHLVEGVGQMAGIGHRAVVDRPTEEECPIVEDAVAMPPAEADRRNRDAVAGQTAIVGEDCHLQRQ